MIDLNMKSGRRAFCRLMAFVFFFIGCSAQVPVSAKSPQKALRVGDKAPDFDLPIQGKDAYLSLSGLVEDGPVVVIVLRGYPGYKCQFCSSQVGSMLNRARKLASVL